MPIPKSQSAQDGFEQTEMIFQGIHKNTMQAFINYKAYYDKKAKASKLKEQQQMYVPQRKADHQRSRTLFTDFRWIGPYIVEKTLPNNTYLVPKLGTNKTQVLRRMKLRLFTPRQPIPEVQTTSQERKPDPEVIKHNDPYARARESEFEKPIFDLDRHKPNNHNSSKTTKRHDLANYVTSIIPGTIREGSPELSLRQMK